jgi:hypothetical protein
MLFLTSLFEPNTYVLPRGNGRQNIYKDNRILIARILFSQYKKAETLGLLRKEKYRGNDCYFLNRKAIRALHGRTKIKKLYLRYCKDGKIDQPTRPAPVADMAIGMFAQAQIRRTRTVLSDIGIYIIKESIDCKLALIEFFKITDRTLRNWVAERSPMLTTPDAIDIICGFTKVNRDLLTQKKPI